MLAPEAIFKVEIVNCSTYFSGAKNPVVFISIPVYGSQPTPGLTQLILNHEPTLAQCVTCARIPVWARGYI